MFKHLKIETKIILAFMLPVMLIMITVIISYFHIGNMEKESRLFQGAVLEFIKNYPENSDENIETADYVSKFKTILTKNYKKRAEMLKIQRITSMVMVQISILLIILIGFFMAKHIRQMIEAEKQKSTDADNKDELFSDILKSILLEYQHKTGRNPSNLLQNTLSKLNSR